MFLVQQPATFGRCGPAGRNPPSLCAEEETTGAVVEADADSACFAVAGHVVVRMASGGQPQQQRRQCPCSMAAQARADPPWAIRNYGGQGISSPALTRSEIGDFARSLSSRRRRRLLLVSRRSPDLQPHPLLRYPPLFSPLASIPWSRHLQSSPAWLGDYFLFAHTLPDALPM